MSTLSTAIPASPADELLRTCRRLYDYGLLAAGDGNVSCRLEDGRILTTPRGAGKAFITADDLAVLSPEGTVLRGQPTSEIDLHLEVYRRAPGARAVCHAHPPHAIAWSLGRPADTRLPEALPEVILATGGIPVAPYGMPGSKDLAAKTGRFVPEFRLILMSRHGGLAWGETLAEAAGGLERLEHVCRILILAAQLGPLRPLADTDLEELRAKRQTLGPRIY